jgi:hypothetical protein
VLGTGCRFCINTGKFQVLSNYFFILCQFQGKLTGTLPDSSTCVKPAFSAFCVLGVRCRFYVNTLFGTPGGTLNLIKMLDIQDVLDVTFNELTLEQQLLLKEAIEQFQQKCLLSFSKNRSGVPFLKSEMPRVLMLGETDTTAAAEKQKVFGLIQQTMEDIMARHNTVFLSIFRQMMVAILAQAWTNILNKEIQVLLLLVNHLVKMQVCDHLHRV